MQFRGKGAGVRKAQGCRTCAEGVLVLHVHDGILAEACKRNIAGMSTIFEHDFSVFGWLRAAGVLQQATQLRDEPADR